MDFTVEIVLQNLATQLNVVGFRDNRNFRYFEARVLDDTWNCVT